jgi:hypothetical protein
MTGFLRLSVLLSLLHAHVAVCISQEPSGPPTLENLVNAPESQSTPASPEAEAPAAGPKRPAGIAVRPKDGVQHPDLDKAWAEYDATVDKAGAVISAAISKQFDAATQKGDLDAAEKWQTALEKFDKAGEVPAEKEIKAAVSSAVTDYKKADDSLAKAYELVVKTLTMEKKISEAKAVRRESNDVRRRQERGRSAAGSSERGQENNQPAQARGRKWTLVLWNTHNSHWRDRGTRTCDVTAVFAGKPVFEKKEVEVPWFRDRDANVAVEILSPGIDSIRVAITSWNGPGSGGLAEIQLFDDKGQNVAATYRVTASASGGEGGPETLIDGDTAAGGRSRWCLPNGQLGWVELSLPDNRSGSINKVGGPSRGGQQPMSNFVLGDWREEHGWVLRIAPAGSGTYHRPDGTEHASAKWSLQSTGRLEVALSNGWKMRGQRQGEDLSIQQFDASGRDRGVGPFRRVR